MPQWLAAGAWGWLAGSALLIGALSGWFLRLPMKLVAIVMSFGAGVLISALSFDLMDEAARRGGLLASAIGFILGACTFTGANWVLSRRGAKHRKRTKRQPTEDEHEGSGTAIALGALLDGIPESIVIGTSLLGGERVSLVAVVAIFLSNLPEGLSSAVGMRVAGRSLRYVLGLWAGIALISGVASIIGFVAFDGVDPKVVSVVTAIAAGAILAMIVDTMVPEAVEETHALAGLVTVLGFLCAFALTKAEQRRAQPETHAPSRATGSS